MNLFTRPRIVKGHNIKISTPLIIEPADTDFESLCNKVPMLASLHQEENLTYSFEQESLEYQAEIKAQAENIIAEAEEKAKAILTSAEAEAMQIKEQAQNEIENWKAQIAEEVRTETLLKANEEAQQIIEKASNTLQLTQQVLASEYEKVDKELMSLAIRIANRLVRTTLAVKPDYLLNIINALTIIPQERMDLRLYVSPQDASLLHNLPKEILGNLIWSKDETLKPGDMYLEHAEGVIDARIDSQLEKLEYILWEALVHGEMGQAG